MLLSCLVILSERCFKSLYPVLDQVTSPPLPPNSKQGKQKSAFFWMLAVSHFFLANHSTLKVRMFLPAVWLMPISLGWWGPRRFTSHFSSRLRVSNLCSNRWSTSFMLSTRFRLCASAMFVSNFSRGAREDEGHSSHDSSRAPHTTANELWKMKLRCSGTNHICPWRSRWASSTRSKKNLRPLQQRNTLSMRSSIFQVQYTLHWAGGARATLLPLQTNSVWSSKLGLTKNLLKAPNLLFYSTFWGDKKKIYIYIYIYFFFKYIIFVFCFLFFVFCFSCESRWGRAPLAPNDQSPLINCNLVIFFLWMTHLCD